VSQADEQDARWTVACGNRLTGTGRTGCTDLRIKCPAAPRTGPTAALQHSGQGG